MGTKKIFVDTPFVLKNVRDAADVYAQNKALGEGRAGSYEPFRIMVRNDTGADRAEGEVMGVGDSILDEVTNEHAWFEGTTPSFCEPFGVLHRPLRDGEIGPVHVFGACRALVNITNPCHRWATVSSGLHVLQSADSGPIRLLWTPGDLGEQTCLVAFSWEQEEDCPECGSGSGGSGSGSGVCISTFRTSLDSIPGYSNEGFFALTLIDGCLQWTPIQPCEEGSGSGSV